MFVLILRDEDSEVMESMGPMGQRAAEQVAGGASINLNHADYSVAIVEDDEAPAKGEKFLA